MKRHIILSLIFSTLIVCAKGESLRLTLEECVDSALAHNPAVAAAALEVERARVLHATAFDPPKTEVVLKQETTGGGGPENGVFFGQDFEFPTLYVARHRALTARSRLQNSRFRALEAQTENEVTSLYYSLLYTTRLLALSDELREIYIEFGRVAKARYDAGETGVLEVMNAERMQEENEMERRNLEMQHEAYALRLQSVTGCSRLVLPSEEDLTLIPPGFISRDYDFNLTSRGAVANSEVELAEREIAVAKNEFLPGIRVGATVQAFLKGFNPYHIDRERFSKGNFMGIEVGITVPLFFTADASRLKAANLSRNISMLNREAADAEARSEHESLVAALAMLHERLEYYSSTALPRADEIKRISLVSYELGDIDYLEYISNIKTAYALYREYADCINEYNQKVISLNLISQ